MTIEHRVFQGEVRAVGDDKIGGYAAVFESLSENLGGFREKIARGAFDGRLNDDVRALFNHDSSLILGRNQAGTLTLSLDDTGLRYELPVPDTSYGRDLFVSVDRGDVNQSSFGFVVEEDEWREDDEGRVVRTIIKFRQLFDVSPVTFPAYPEASVGVRSFEAFQARQAAKAERQSLQAPAPRLVAPGLIA